MCTLVQLYLSSHDPGTPLCSIRKYYSQQRNWGLNQWRHEPHVKCSDSGRLSRYPHLSLLRLLSHTLILCDHLSVKNDPVLSRIALLYSLSLSPSLPLSFSPSPPLPLSLSRDAQVEMTSFLFHFLPSRPPLLLPRHLLLLFVISACPMGPRGLRQHLQPIKSPGAQSQISPPPCLNPAESLHPDSAASPQLQRAIIPCLPPFSSLGLGVVKIRGDHLSL